MGQKHSEGSMYCVIGVMRSGTSLVAGILHKLGVFMGSVWSEYDTNWCPSGSYCDEEIARIFAATIGWTWTGQVDLSHLPALRAMMASRDKAYGRWGFKCHFAPLVWDHFATDSISLVCTKRAPIESVQSFAACAKVTEAEAQQELQPWLDKVPAIYQSFKGRKLLVEYAELVNNPAATVAKIADFAGLPTNQEAVNLVQPELYRFRTK